jgi:hypothetical protein
MEKRKLVAHQLEQAPASNGDTYPVIVHSHLAWDWVWQRPQQFLSRLSRTHRVLFIEPRRPMKTRVRRRPCCGRCGRLARKTL